MGTASSFIVEIWKRTNNLSRARWNKKKKIIFNAFGSRVFKKFMAACHDCGYNHPKLLVELESFDLCIIGLVINDCIHVFDMEVRRFQHCKTWQRRESSRNSRFFVWIWVLEALSETNPSCLVACLSAYCISRTLGIADCEFRCWRWWHILLLYSVSQLQFLLVVFVHLLSRYFISSM